MFIEIEKNCVPAIGRQYEMVINHTNGMAANYIS
jgi:hypothetical protein